MNMLRGVFFVSLAPISDSALVIPTIAQALGVRDETNQPLLERLKEDVRQKQILLLLDNFEQVIAAPYVADLLAACPKLRVLYCFRVEEICYNKEDEAENRRS